MRFALRQSRFNGAALRRARSAASRRKPASAAGGFNGAALRRARSEDISKLRGMPVMASTGPRSEERGVAGVATYQARSSVLQRGRAPKSAECLRRQGWHRLLHLASTGPRSEERGVFAAIWVARSSWLLQRGRAPKSAECANRHWRLCDG